MKPPPREDQPALLSSLAGSTTDRKDELVAWL
jgi:hypothetical protein